MLPRRVRIRSFPGLSHHLEHIDGRCLMSTVYLAVCIMFPKRWCLLHEIIFGETEFLILIYWVVAWGWQPYTCLTFVLERDIYGRRERDPTSMKPGSGLCIHCVGLALPHLIPGHNQDPRQEWGGVWVSGRWWGNRSVMGTPPFIMPPLLECEPLLSQPRASCQSEEIRWITKAQPHRLSGCISRSLWRGGWNFLCLAI